MRLAINAATISPGGGLTVLCGVVEAILSSVHSCRIIVGNPETYRILNDKYGESSQIDFFLGVLGLPVSVRFLWQTILMRRSEALEGCGAILCFNGFYYTSIPQIVYHINLMHFMIGVSLRLSKRGISGLLKDFAALNALKKADYNLFESFYLKRCAQEFVGDITRPDILYFRSGFDPGFYVPVDMDQVNIHRVVAITSDQPHKDNLTLIRMMRVLQNCSCRDLFLDIVGGDGNAFHAERQLAGELGVDDKVNFIGRVKHSDLSRMLSQSLCLVSASKVESFCMVAVEAMSVGCPVVVTECTAMPESVGDWGRVVSAGDADAFARSVLEYRDNPDLRKSMVEGGLSFVKRYSREAFESKFLSVIEAVTDDDKPDYVEN